MARSLASSHTTYVTDGDLERLNLAALATQDLIWDWDLQRKRVTWAGATQPFFGCEPGDVAASEGSDYHAWASRVHPDDLAVTEAAAKALSGSAASWEHEYRIRRMDGSWAHVLERAFIVRDAAGKALRVVGALRDITKRFESEEAKTRLSAIVASSSDAIIGKTLEGVVTSWNAAAERIFGYADGEIVGRSIFTLIPPELHDTERVLLERIRRGEAVEFAQAERVRKDGTHIFIALSVSPIRDGSGRVVGASSIKRDITSQKRAQEELVRSEARYRALVTATSSLVWAADPEGRFRAPQRSWEEYTGQLWAEERDFGWLQAFHPDDREPVRAAWAAACRAQTVFEAHGRVWNASRQTHRHCMTRAVPIPESDGSVHEWIGMLTDVEDRWLTDERLRQAERMEVVGRLAGGIAHEVNNQMTVVLGAAGYLLPHVPGESERRDVEYIQRAAQRTATITRQLLAFSRQQLLQPRIVDLNAVITALRPILERALGERSTISLELDSSLGVVKADPGQLEQVLLNLVLNARDAMPRGGALCIETSTAVLEATDVSGRPPDDALRGTYAMLAVSDTGEGMTPETLRHIFEPFYTTKGVGEGSGLGLATVYGIVKQSGGSVSVSSQRGRGTRFTIYLPLSGPSDAPAPVAGALEVPGGTESVLVVEDEPSVRAFMGRTLRSLGYAVSEAGGGAEGLELVHGQAGRIDLVIADVVMPGLGGRELAIEMARLFPAVRVLLTSGYPGSDVADVTSLGKGRGFISKPVGPEELARKVREMLDAD